LLDGIFTLTQQSSDIYKMLYIFAGVSNWSWN